MTRRDSLNGDAWDGLVLTRWPSRRPAWALAASPYALRLHPDNSTTRDLLTRIDPDWDRPVSRTAGAAASHPARGARTRGDFFESAAVGGWRRFYVNGVSVGVALPGGSLGVPPTRPPTAGWFRLIAGMHANTLRHHTILPPFTARFPPGTRRIRRPGALAGARGVDRAAARARLQRRGVERRVHGRRCGGWWTCCTATPRSR
ncbi:MAG: hypothetical protein IPJ57_12340 [Gemmatimonadetes bacterium]|nr:hypothetical protein [Gemmatimonadota bacterium]